MFVALRICMSVCLSQLLCVSVRVFVYMRYSFFCRRTRESLMRYRRRRSQYRERATSLFC